MRSEKVMNQILYGEGVYVSALPCLAMAAASDAFDSLIIRLIRKFDRCK